MITEYNNIVCTLHELGISTLWDALSYLGKCHETEVLSLIYNSNVWPGSFTQVEIDTGANL